MSIIGKFANWPFTLIKEYRNLKTTAKNPQHNDVYVVEFPKSGITWLSSLLANMALKASWRNEIASYMAAHLYVPDIHITRNIGSLPYHIPPVRFIKSHSEFNQKYPFVIYLVRNPISVMRSYYRYCIQMKIINAVNFDEFCRLKKYGAISWNRHVCSWISGNTISQRLHLVRYEDLMTDTFAQIKMICENFGWKIDDEIIEYSVKASSAEVMKQSEDLVKKHNPRYQLDFIKGRDDLNIETKTINYINEVCKEGMQLCGYC